MNMKPQIEPQVKTDQAVEGFKRIGEAAEKMGQRVEDSGEKAGKGFEKVGENAPKPAEKIDRATRSIISSIERTTAALQAGERGSASYFETLAKQRGVSGEALAPYIAQLRQAEVAQKAATQSLGTMGVSAAQTAAALRNVPAQFTDIITSLQGGQAPLTVLLQQGGQLKDMFGGVGEAAKALGGFVAGLITPFTVAGAAVAALGAGFFYGAKEAQEFNKALVLTGNQAGVTVGQLSAMAARLDALGTTQGKASEVLIAFAQSGRVGAESLERFALAAINLEKVGGPAVEETVKAFAELGKDPLQASLKLNESTGFLTKSLYEQIKALEDQGRSVEAAKVAQEAYSAAIEDRTPQIVAQLGYVERAWKSIVQFGREAIDQIKEVGRVDNSLEAAIARTEKEIRAAILVGDAIAQVDGEQLLARLRESLKLQQDVNKAQEFSTKQTAAKAEFDKAGEKFLSSQLRLEREIAQARELGLRAGEKEEQIQSRIANIRKAAAEKNKSNNSATRELEREADLIAQLSGLTKTYNEDLKSLQSSKAKGNITEAQYVAFVGELISKQPFAVKLEKERAEAQKASAKALDDLLKADERYLAGLANGSQAIQKQILALEDEEEATRLAAAGQLSLAQAIQKVAIARLEESKAKATALGDFQTAAALAEEIAARERLAELIGSQEGRKAAAEAAKDAATEWKRAAQDIERSLTDALLRGFESGKDFAKNLRDTLVNMFKTLVLRPIIQPVMSGITEALGFAGQASSAGQGVSGLSSLSSIGSLFTNGLTSSLANAIGGAGKLFGSQALSSFSAGMKGGTLAPGLAGPTTAGAGGAVGAGASFSNVLASAGPIAALAAIGYFGGKAISNGYSVSGSQGSNSAALLGGGAFLSGSTGALTGGLGGGVINRLFGRRPQEVTDTGLMGSIGGGNLTGQTYQDWQRKGGIFRSTKRGTELSAIDGELESALDAGAKALLDNAKEWAQALALPAEQLAFVTTSFRTQLTGNAQEDEAAIGAILQSYSDALTSGFAEQLAPFRVQGETAAQTLERLAGSLVGVNDVLGALGQSLFVVSATGGDTASKLLEQFGGLQQFQSAAGQFFQDYYTEAEKTALATKQLTQQLATVGVALPSSRDAYRDLVEAQDLNTESGRKAYAALLQLAPSFAELVPAFESLGDSSAETARKAAEAAEQIVEAGRRMLDGIATDRERLEVDLLRAQGNDAGAIARERANTLARSTAGLNATDTAAVTAALAYNNALADQITNLRAATEAQKAAEQAAAQAAQQAIAEAQRRAEAILSERTGLQDQLDQLLLTNAELLNKQRSALDESNRALFDQVQAASAAKTAAEQLAQAQEAAAQAEAQRVAGIANERTGLEDRLLQLQGDTAAIRARELLSLDASNRALLERIFALEDAQAAEQQAAEATRQAAEAAAQALDALNGKLNDLASTRFDLENELLGLNGNAGEVARRTRERDLAGLTQGLSATDAARVTAAYDYNLALRQQIEATTAAQEAAKALAEEQTRAADEAQRAADEFRSAWQSITDTLFDEVARIRGLLGIGGGDSLASAQARFAIATAQARAGDQEAAKLLPGLSQTLLGLAEQSAASLIDLQRIRAQVAASLEQTGTGLAGRFGLNVPKFEVGTNYVPRDMLAMLHEGEAVVPRAYNPAAGGEGSAALVQEVRGLREDNAAQALAIVKLQADLGRIVRRWDTDGMPEVRATA